MNQSATKHPFVALFYPVGFMCLVSTLTCVFLAWEANRAVEAELRAKQDHLQALEERNQLERDYIELQKQYLAAIEDHKQTLIKTHEERVRQRALPIARFKDKE